MHFALRKTAALNGSIFVWQPNAALGSLKLEKHPDKTFIGRIERGFDFPGYRFAPAGLGLAQKTVANFYAKASRLYEQKRNLPARNRSFAAGKAGAAAAAAALEMDVMR